MPVEYYIEDFLLKVGDTLEKVLKIDQQTLDAARGKYGRLCVEIDLKEPLTPYVWIDDELQAVE